MADPEGPDLTSNPLAIVGSATAPFIYFDATAAMGTNNGAIEIELCSRTMIPVPPGAGVRHEIVITAHLRCSPVAAAALREGINKALDLLTQSQEQPAASPGKLN